MALLTNLGAQLRRQGKQDEAIACYRQALEIDPTFAMAHSNLGNALWRQHEEAIAAHEEAVRWEGANPKYLVLLAKQLTYRSDSKSPLTSASKRVMAF